MWVKNWRSKRDWEIPMEDTTFDSALPTKVGVEHQNITIFNSGGKSYNWENLY